MALLDTFANPPREYTLIPFWFLNDELDKGELKRQIDDFAAHGVYGFIPHARMGLPDSIPFMSDAWLHYVKLCVDYAAQKEMVVVLYDEGMYPSGSCAGQVVAENPRYATRCLHRRRKGPVGDDEHVVAEDANHIYVNCRSNGHIRGVHYGTDDGQPGAPPSGDLLSPEAMACFRRLVLDGYYEALKGHFGKTVTAVFTDEPDVMGRGHRRGALPWTWGFEGFLEEYLGYDMRPHFAALFDGKHKDHAPVRRDWDRTVNARLEQVYYEPYSKWCDEHGVCLTGHPAQPGDIGTEKYFHMPGQDIVWRYIEPFQDKSLEGPQSTMAKCSVSAQRHYGRTRNINECFGAYGWEFTEEEMWWVTNWLFARGVNCLMPHAFYYSIRDKRRDERPPDVGPNNVWWPRYKTFADYCTRLSWLLSQGVQVCHFAILGSATTLPWRAARCMFESQRDFNYLDIDTLLSRCRVSEDGIRVHDMHYAALVVDGPEFADLRVRKAIQPLLNAGRVVSFGEPTPGLPATVGADKDMLLTALDRLVPADVTLEPATPHLRYTHMRTEDADLYVFANEGRETLTGALCVRDGAAGEWWNPETGAVIDGQPPEAVRIPPYRIHVLCRKRA